MDVAHSCRCCLRRPPDKDLTTPYTHLGNTEIYSDMLKECFEIHLIIDSEADVGICDVCVGRLRDASDFKLQVQRSQIELHAWLQETLQVKEEKQAVESIMEDGDGSSEGAPINSELDTEDGTNDEERQELSYERAGEVEMPNDDEEEMPNEDEEDCISLVRAGAGRADSEPALSVSARAREQLAMVCSVRLERLRGDEAPHAIQTCLATSRRGPRLASRVKDTPDDTAGLRADEQAYTCDTCGEHFTDKARLIKHIQEHMGSKRDGCNNKRYVNKSVSKQQKLIHTGKAPFNCDICKKQFWHKGHLNVHIRSHAGEKPYGCKQCNKKFTRIYGLIMHNRIHIEENDFICVECNEQFTNKPDLVVHKRSHADEKSYSCKVCHKRFKHKNSYYNHQIIHTGNKPHSCSECSMQFKRKDHLYRHKRTHAGVKPYSCKECNLKFSQRYNLTAHEKIHTEPYSCEVCYYQFSNKRLLDEHKRTHTREKPYSCNECNKRFSSASYFRAHTRTHTGEKRYGCDECNKGFVTKGVLDKHKTIHARVKYTCSEEQCNKSFTQEEHLIKHKMDHLTSHTEEQPHVCEYCEKLFTTKDSLITHRRIHTGNKLFSCDICNKQFTVIDHLNNHKITHAGEKPYSCDECGEQFSLKGQLNRHKSYHTREQLCEICETYFPSKLSLRKHIKTHMNRKS